MSLFHALGSATGSASVSHRYLYGAAVDEILAVEDYSKTYGAAERVLYALADPQGTVRDVVKYDSGASTTILAEHRKYDTFGNATSTWALDFDFGYTGKIYDVAAGLYYYGNRWYDSRTGRFTSEDPALSTWNLYVYCGNDPVNNTDPTGLCSQSYSNTNVSLYDSWSSSVGLGSYSSSSGYLTLGGSYSGGSGVINLGGGYSGGSSASPISLGVGSTITTTTPQYTLSTAVNNLTATKLPTMQQIINQDTFTKMQQVQQSYVANALPTGAGAGSISLPEFEYAASNSKMNFALNNPGTATKMFFESLGNFVPYQGWTSSTRNELINQMHSISQEANKFASDSIRELGADNTERNHAALRHSYASAQYAKLLGPAAAASLGHYREEYQLLHGQSPERTQRTDWNNSMGRKAAGAFGEGNTFGFGYSGPKSDQAIRESIKQMYREGYLDVGGQTGPRRPGEPLTPSPVYPRPFPQVPK